MVVEGLALGMVPGRAEGLLYELLGQLEEGQLAEGLVEVEDRAGAQQAVPGQSDLAGGVDVEDLELHARAGGNSGDPHVEIRVLSRFEVDDIVAALELANLVDLLEVLPLFELRLRLVVRQELLEVLHEVSELRCHPPAGEDERPLLVAPTGLLLDVGGVGEEVRVRLLRRLLAIRSLLLALRLLGCLLVLGALLALLRRKQLHVGQPLRVPDFFDVAADLPLDLGHVPRVVLLVV
mmetsp:Transcript_93519/g.209343  ORF Transcript_93519/g.209343 Transcript_93519/m.209343 type:complete len:236 (-) Transcript_93519:94-801(-)